MDVAQVLGAAGPVDAVTQQVLAWRRRFRDWGWGGSDYARYRAPGVRPGLLSDLADLDPGRADVLLVHYSGYVPGLDLLIRSHPRTLLLSHNITPARYFWEHEPLEAVRCQLAREQLARLSEVATMLVGVSEFNAAELRALGGREAGVVPVLFDHSPLPSADGAAPGPPTLLFVGRFVPHKRQDLLIGVLARYRQTTPDARLVLVGGSGAHSYSAWLRRLADELAAGAVRFETEGISEHRLGQYYSRAQAFVCLSEHEGFGIPLLEAFHFGLPVIAREAGAVGEVIGDAGLMVGSDDGVATVAELVQIVAEDAELRGELRERGRRRLSAYDVEVAAALMREQLLTLARPR